MKKAILLLLALLACSCTHRAYPDIKYVRMCTVWDYKYYKPHTPRWYERNQWHYYKSPITGKLKSR